MRVYLDTNALIYFLYNAAELSDDTCMILSDYSNILLTSTVCVQELIHLVQIGKVQNVSKGRRKAVAPESIMQSITETNIEVVPVSKLHLTTFATLPLLPDHRDPNDRLIIAQAIADKIPLISSDRKFSQYETHGLNFIFNER